MQQHNKHALVLCDDYWHPARTIRAGLAPLQAEHSFDWIEHAADWSPQRMADYETVLLSKSNHVSSADQTPWMDQQAQAAFAEYVRAGKGLLAIHSGTAGYSECTILRGLLGGVFVSHPAQCSVDVRPRGEHRLISSSNAFEVFDEHYQMQLDDTSAEVFLETVSEHGTQPGGWTRREGAGRICVLTPGHNLDVWLHPSYQTLIHNALLWCAGK